eukprot:TRINITY_DN73422_c0_g1_i1.p1 TRINITY_DN73422_c0_g1~~TRINITY_DN73422_c0_g1_i1.p1  ORF type:complete len:280 (+),score=41.26 TRINITY_DN73422_c0_g1_i1:74-913(+)
MACRCSGAPKLKRNCRLRRFLKHATRHKLRHCRRIRQAQTDEPRPPLRPPRVLQGCPERPRCIYLLRSNAHQAVCWRPQEDSKSGFCSVGFERLAYNCRTCTVASFDAEWCWQRPIEAGVALLQLAFWPSGDVFCIRLALADDGEDSSTEALDVERSPDGSRIAQAPDSVKQLISRAEKDEVVLAGFSIHQDVKRLVRHGILLPEQATVDMQPWCSGKRPSISLVGAALQHLGVYVDKGPRLSDWEGPLSHMQLRYAAEDAWITLRLYSAMPPQSLPNR